MQLSHFPPRVALLQENPALRANNFLHKDKLNSDMRLFLTDATLDISNARYPVNVFVIGLHVYNDAVSLALVTNRYRQVLTDSSVISCGKS
jgi:hypothetical protein